MSLIAGLADLVVLDIKIAMFEAVRFF